ncbi:uncharacterized protein LOC144910208 isoform X2 [Branchiostoma floridae x Branchiostoma belcheri]
MRPLVPVLAFCLAFLPAAVKCAPTEDDLEDDSDGYVLPGVSTYTSMATPPMPDVAHRILQEALESREPADREKREPRSADDVCEDSFYDQCACRYWALTGVCETYKPWMHTYCKKSCGNCTSTEEGECIDHLPVGSCNAVLASPDLLDLAQACCQKSGDFCPANVQLTQFEEECMTSHNAIRVLHDAAPLQWDEKCAEEARRYAEKLKNRFVRSGFRVHPLKHATRAERTWAVDGQAVVHGENLYWTFNSVPGCTGETRYSNAVKSWYEEVEIYIQARRRGRPVTRSGIEQYGHFTQIVWKDTTAFGCGRSGDEPNNILCCYYEIRGNKFSTPQFDQNVKI